MTDSRLQAVLAAAALLRQWEPEEEDVGTRGAAKGAAMLLLRYTYMVLLTLVGWRLLVADVIGDNRNHSNHRRRRVTSPSSGFFVGILLNAFLFKAEVLAPRVNYAARMAVYYAGCACLAASPAAARRRAATDE